VAVSAVLASCGRAVKGRDSISWSPCAQKRRTVGLKGSAKGESPMAPLVMEMARAVIGQKGDDTSIITPNLDLASMRPTVIP